MAELSSHQVLRIQRICCGICELCEAPCSPACLVPHLWEDPKEHDLSKWFLLLCPLCREHVAQIPLPRELALRRIDLRSYSFRRMLRRILGITLPPYEPPPGLDPSSLYREACETWCLNGAG